MNQILSMILRLFEVFRNIHRIKPQLDDKMPVTPDSGNAGCKIFKAQVKLFDCDTQIGMRIVAGLDGDYCFRVPPKIAKELGEKLIKASKKVRVDLK